MAERDIGTFIRDMRRNAKVSLRQLADQAGVSNPYLSQIERGLRKPSAEVLQQIANALKVSTPLMYLRAGLLNQKDGPGTLAAIAADPDLSTRQKQTLTEIYEAFRRENIREEGTDLDDGVGEEVIVTDQDVANIADELNESPLVDDQGKPAETIHNDTTVATPAPRRTARKTARAGARKRTKPQRPAKEEKEEELKEI